MNLRRLNLMVLTGQPEAGGVDDGRRVALFPVSSGGEGVGPQCQALGGGVQEEAQHSDHDPKAG